MGVLTFENEIPTSFPPAKLFNVFVLKSHVIIPKIVPHISIEFLEGDGGPGTIRKSTFSQGDIKYIKTKVEKTDKDNFTHNYTVIDGEPWQEGLEKIGYEIKIKASPDGGSICKTTSKYYPKEGCTLDEEQIKIGEEKALGLFKVIEAHISANPDAYN